VTSRFEKKKREALERDRNILQQDGTLGRRRLVPSRELGPILVHPQFQSILIVTIIVTCRPRYRAWTVTCMDLLWYYVQIVRAIQGNRRSFLSCTGCSTP
jgi:hypothetical protein